MLHPVVPEPEQLGVGHGEHRARVVQRGEVFTEELDDALRVVMEEPGDERAQRRSEVLDPGDALAVGADLVREIEPAQPDPRPAARTRRRRLRDRPRC